MATIGGFSVTLRPIAFVGGSVVAGDVTTKADSSSPSVVLIGASATIGSNCSAAVVIGTSATIGNDSGQSIAIGVASSVGNSSAQNIVIGVAARVTDNVNQSIVMSTGAQSESSGCIVMGVSSHVFANCSASIALGQGSKIGQSSSQSVAIGPQVVIGDHVSNSIAIGSQTSVGTIGGTGAVNSIAIGLAAAIADNVQNSIAIGLSASITAGSANSIAIGLGANVTGTGSQAYGQGATCVASNTVVFGSSATPILSFYVRTNLGANLDLFSFESTLAAANNDTSMSVLYKNDSGVVVNAHVTVDPNTGALSVPIATPANKIVYSKTFQVAYTDFVALGGNSGFIDIPTPFAPSNLLVLATAKVEFHGSFTGAGITTSSLQVGSSGSSGPAALISPFSVITETHVENSGTDSAGYSLSYPAIRVTLTVDSSLNLLTNGSAIVVVQYTLS
jgi:hypothetical protein